MHEIGTQDSLDANQTQEGPGEEPEVCGVCVRNFVPNESSSSTQREVRDDVKIFGPRTVTFTGEGRPRIRRLRPGKPSMGLRGVERSCRDYGSEDDFRDLILSNNIIYSASGIDSSEEDDDRHLYSPSAQDI